VRSRESIALEEILSGSIVQGSLPAAMYAEKFYSRSRILTQESQSSLCHHFLRGLRPELRPLCCLDQNNQPWTSLHALVQHTFAEELRYHVRYPASRPQATTPSSFQSPSGFKPPSSYPPSSRDQPPSRFHPYQQPPSFFHGKHAPLSSRAPYQDPSQWPQKSAAKQFQRVENRKRKHVPHPASLAALPAPAAPPRGLAPAQNPLRPELTLDISLCPMYRQVTNRHTNPLTQAQKDVCKLWGLCYWCKEERHDALTCPKKGRPQP
jgi:hypothetical protein